MTDTELRDLLDRCTPAPWRIADGTPGHIKSYWDGHEMSGEHQATPTVAQYDIWSRHTPLPTDLEKWAKQEQANAALIALAPTLAAELIEARAERDALREALKFVDDAIENEWTLIDWATFGPVQQKIRAALGEPR